MNISDHTQHILEEIQQIYSDLYSDNLIGIYVHGSLAMGCYNPESSDIDFLIIIKNPLTLPEKQRLTASTLHLIANTTEKLEFSVIIGEQLEHFTYPTPFEFHYSG